MSKVQNYSNVVGEAIQMIDFERHAIQGSEAKEHYANVETLRCSYGLWLSLLADLSLEAGLTTKHTRVLLLKLVDIINSMTYVQLSEICGACYETLRVQYSYESFKYSSFKHCDGLQPFIGLLRIFIEKVRSEASPVWLQRVLTMCVFPFRTRVVDSGLQGQMLEDYLTIEDEIKRHDVIGYPNELVNELNRYLTHWLRDWKNPVTPSLTSGSVSDEDLKTKVQKYSNLSYDRRIDLLLQEEGAGRLQDYSPFLLGPKDRTERIIFVPKNSTKLRTVCCQPVGLQYWQAGVQKSIYRYIASHSILRQHIPLFTANYVGERPVGYSCTSFTPGELALKGSKHSCYGTLDLSAASDRISWQLVQQCFAGTRYLKWLEATRSTCSVISIADRNIELLSRKAFAMGACNCFPTMSLLLAAIVAFSVELTHPYEDNVHWTVYGDDIIAPNDTCVFVGRFLEALGLRVNTQKSFYGYNDSYRESCGIEGWNGFDITPFRFPRTFRHNMGVTDGISAYTMVANSAFMLDYRVTRHRTLLQMGSKYDAGPYGSKPIKFVPNPDKVKHPADLGGLYTTSATNYKVKHRDTVMWPITVRYYTVLDRWGAPLVYNGSVCHITGHVLAECDIGHEEVQCQVVANKAKMCFNSHPSSVRNTVLLPPSPDIVEMYTQDAVLARYLQTALWPELPDGSFSGIASVQTRLRNVEEEVRYFDWLLTNQGRSSGSSAESQPMDVYAFRAQFVPSLKSGWQPTWTWSPIDFAPFSF